MADLMVRAPMRGWAAPLAEVDDPVFSSRMLGDGLAIDPTSGEVRAPFDGTVLNIHAAAHAVSLRAANGVELLIHIGLDTVALSGEGFQRHVDDGAKVKVGDLLISIDLDQVAARAKSLMTPLVVTNGDAFTIVHRHEGRRVEVGDELLLIRGEHGAERAESAEIRTVTRRVVIPLAHGLHARPSALIAAEVRRHHANVTLAASGRTANAKSPVAIMTLGLSHQDCAVLSATGPDAEAALAAVADLIEHGLPPEPIAPSPPAAAQPAPDRLEMAPGVLSGTPAAPGLAIGPAVRMIAPEPKIVAQSQGIEPETRALTTALATVRSHLAAQAELGPREQREIIQAHLAFLDDQALVDTAQAAIAAGQSAGRAWRHAIRTQVEILSGVGDSHIAQRADDLIDIERQVLFALSGEVGSDQELPESAILVAEDVGPGQLMGLGGRLAGICLAGGGPTSHVAILATAMNIPAIVAVGPALASVADGTTLILDGGSGEVRVAPDAGEIDGAKAQRADLEELRRTSQALAAELCHTADGTRIEVLANVGSLADAEAARANGAEGCGLLRTEFLFLERSTPPSEDEQTQSYQAIAKALDGRPVVVRTLDIGGDKPAPFLDLPREENPALGLRGVRVSLSRPELLREQLRAILRVQPQGQCRILVPMIASVAELRRVSAMVETVRAEMVGTGPIQVGVMIETPAAAITADIMAEHADFLSIGTNDLTQYVLAMDRGNPQMASQIDALHPAVLRMIAETTRGARKHGRPVAVCGGLAADTSAAAILLGLGVTELSAPPAILPELKAAVRRLTLPACEALARRALECADAAAVRRLITSAGSREGQP